MGVVVARETPGLQVIFYSGREPGSHLYSTVPQPSTSLYDGGRAPDLWVRGSQLLEGYQ